MDKLIITAAISGSRITREMTPYIPITPEEIVQSAIECQELEIFKQVVEPLREKTDLILCLTTSGIPGRNLPIEERLAPLELRPELASFDAGSINLGGSVFINSPEFLEQAASKMMDLGVKPELEIFDSGMLTTCLRMRDAGKLKAPFHFQFVLGTPWGAAATAKSLLYLHEYLPENSTWSVIGIGKGHLPMSMMAFAMGGHTPKAFWQKPMPSL
jgi:3-keto-5-aminohexanoate cleavage enzyme